MTEMETYRPGILSIPGESTTTRIHSAQDAAVQRLGEWAHSAQAAYQVAENLVRTSFVPEGFRGKPHEATAAILSGLEVGLSPMAALRSFDVIQGTAAPRAITLRAIVQSHGHEMEIVESNATRCKMRGRRRGATNWQEVVWTIDRAKQLGLVGKANWKNQPQAMLVARATSELARLIASDAILGIGYSSEEVADGGAADAQVTAETTAPAAQQTTRKMSRKTKPANEDGTPARDEEGQRRAMFAAFRDAGFSDERTDDGRAERLAFISNVVGRDVETSSDLSWDEVSAVIDAVKVAQHPVADEPTPVEEPAADELPIEEPPGWEQS